MPLAEPRTVRTIGLRVSVVFLLATAVISQCLEWLRARLGIDSDVVAPAQYGPALAALVTWLIYRHHFGDLMPARVGSRRVRADATRGVAACGLFAILLWIGYSLIGGHASYGIKDVDATSFWLIAVVWLFGATAEEIGWRGVLQPALETRLPRWGAGLVTGLLWSVWHLPVITLGVAVALVFTASTTVLAVLMAYLGNGSPAQRVLTTSLVHWLVNLAILVVAGVRTDLTELVPELVAVSVTTIVVLTVLGCRTRSRAPAAPARSAVAG